MTLCKIVLAACSQFFRGLLASLPMQTTGSLHPAVLYMRGVTGATLLKLLDFMYNGEVNVERAVLKEFLQLGEDLRVQGLCESLAAAQQQPVANQEKSKAVKSTLSATPAKQNAKMDGNKSSVKVEKKKRKMHNKENLSDNLDVSEKKQAKKEIPEENIKNEIVEVLDSSPEDHETVAQNEDRLLMDRDRRTPTSSRKKVKKSLEDLRDDAINRDVVTMDPGEAHGILKLIENIPTILEQSEDLNVFVQLLNQLVLKNNVANDLRFFCGLCHKNLKSKQHMLNHIEANHVKGVQHICAECGLRFKTRSNLYSHKNKMHKPAKRESDPSPGNKEELMEGNKLDFSDEAMNNYGHASDLPHSASLSEDNSNPYSSGPEFE